jgi:hypothetical protein
MKTFTSDEIKEILDPQFWPVINGWLGRNDGVAVYRNEAMDSIGHGERQFVSYGSELSQLETKEPPERLPDIGGKINWRFRLEGIYRGTYLIASEVVPGPNKERGFDRQVIGRQLPPDLWTKIEPDRCDLCSEVARWKHPKGGRRCNKCPRPK